MPRTGRRPGAGGTREKILAAARSHFGEEGYDGATMRGIAAGAGVDPAMIPHDFGSKEGVFLAAVQFPVDPAEFIPRLLEPGISENDISGSVGPVPGLGTGTTLTGSWKPVATTWTS